MLGFVPQPNRLFCRAGIASREIIVVGGGNPAGLFFQRRFFRRLGWFYQPNGIFWPGKLLGFAYALPNLPDCMRKLLHIAYGVLKHKKRFDPHWNIPLCA